MTTTADAAEGVQLLQKQCFDLVITDVLMPDGDGLELIALLKRAHPLVPIVAMSGGGRYLEGHDCLKIARGWRVHQALMKPFDRAQLSSAMDEALAAAEVLPRPASPARGSGSD